MSSRIHIHARTKTRQTAITLVDVCVDTNGAPLEYLFTRGHLTPEQVAKFDVSHYGAINPDSVELPDNGKAKP